MGHPVATIMPRSDLRASIPRKQALANLSVLCVPLWLALYCRGEDGRAVKIDPIVAENAPDRVVKSKGLPSYFRHRRPIQTLPYLPPSLASLGGGNPLKFGERARPLFFSFFEIWSLNQSLQHRLLSAGRGRGLHCGPQFILSVMVFMNAIFMSHHFIPLSAEEKLHFGLPSLPGSEILAYLLPSLSCLLPSYNRLSYSSGSSL